jgi:phospholipid/cholesterol/gamma-HCH transport system ATP-binding protein
MLKTAPEIRLEKVDAGYGKKKVVSAADFVLPSGKISVILGGSGSGKSTLLKHILGIHPPIGGRIFFDGVELSHMLQKDFKGLRRSMGVLFQDGALLGSLSLGDNIAMPLREHTDLDESTIETVVRLKLGLVGLESFIEFFPAELSGGMRKRAGLARALVLDPSILLCDEPSAGLDPITAADLDRLILDLAETFKMTIVVVTHDLKSLFSIAEHVVVLNQGKVIFEGSLEALLQSRDPYIVRFLEREPRDT